MAQRSPLPAGQTRYAHLKETLEVLSDPRMMQQSAESRACYRSDRKSLSFETVLGEPMAPRRSAMANSRALS